MQIVELASRVGPARRQYDVARRGQPPEASIAVDLQHTTEVLEMSGRTLCLAIRTVEVDGGRRFGPGPGSIVARIDPQPTGFGAAAAGIEHRDRRVVSKQLGRSKHMGCEASLQRLPPTQFARVERSIS